MSADPWRVPVIASAGQWTERVEPTTPVDLAERAALAALDDARGIRGHIDRLHVVGVLFDGGPAPASALAARLGLRPSRCATTTIGGNTPQWLVGRAADDVASGRVGSVLIAGAEAVHSRQLRDAFSVGPSARGGSGAGPDSADPVEGDGRTPLSEAERASGLRVPAEVFPLFESALAHRAGRSYDSHRQALGGLMAPLSAVAAANPLAWFPTELTPEAIAGVSPDNRVAAEPYTKRMNAFMGVDQGAALVVTSLGRARELGLDAPVFVWSAADAFDVWFVSQRPDLAASAGLKAAGTGALSAAGVGVDDVDHLDLYSCFPSALQMAAEALGIATDDRRGLTVTGGLPYFGGPGNNYTTHALATMCARLSGAPAAELGLVSGLGWYMSKHSVGVYGSQPPPAGYRRADTSAAQAAIDASALPVAQDAPGGEAVVVASVVLYDRSGAVTGAPVVARLGDGRRVTAAAADAQLEALAGRNLVGWTVRIDGRPPSYAVVSD
ncbi:MAG: thiolase C-terminal domain-containing protein [Acidimicrobiales bacterium]